MLVLSVVSKDANDDHVPHPPTQASSSEDDLAVLFIDDLGTGDPQKRHGEEDNPRDDTSVVEAKKNDDLGR